MAATTINRRSYTDSDGTPGTGTVWGMTQIGEILDDIDALLSAALTLGNDLTVEGGDLTIGAQNINGAQTASAGTIEGSGGSFQAVVTLSAGMYGTVYVRGKENGTTNVAFYRIDFVTSSASGGISVSTGATVGATSAQLDFQLTGLVLEARGKNATAPAAVHYSLEQWAA